MKRLNIFLMMLFVCVFTCAQQSRAYLDYIEKYSDWAVEQMQAYRIPASITLAQGLLESRAGQSRLAVKANNHFGIKVGRGWTGPYICEDDDAPQERFRKYSSARESYIDHSLFLSQNQRYAPLFQLKTNDYVGWARGLKSCGYATSSTYAQSLIRIIEQYNLDEYDKAVSASARAKAKKVMAARIKEEYTTATEEAHGVFMNNQNYYIIAEADDTFDEIAYEVGVPASRLRKYNDMPKDYEPQEGDIIYLESKRTKAALQFAGFRHVIEAGESMHSISQLYGIKLKSLYQLNGKSPDYSAQPGDILWVR